MCKVDLFIWTSTCLNLNMYLNLNMLFIYWPISRANAPALPVWLTSAWRGQLFGISIFKSNLGWKLSSKNAWEISFVEKGSKTTKFEYAACLDYCGRETPKWGTRWAAWKESQRRRRNTSRYWIFIAMNKKMTKYRIRFMCFVKISVFEKMQLP